MNNRQESLKLAAELIAGRLEVTAKPGTVANWGLSEADPGKVKDRSLCVLLSAVVAHCESDQGYSAALSALIDLIQNDYLDPTRNDPLDAAFAKSVGFQPFPGLEGVLFLQAKDHSCVCIQDNHRGHRTALGEPECPPFVWGSVSERFGRRRHGTAIIQTFHREGWLCTKADLLRLLVCYGISPGSTEFEPRHTMIPENPLHID